MNPTQLERQAISRTLEEILQVVIIQLEHSGPSVWAALSPSEVVEMLRAAIATLREGGQLADPVALASLFAPTAEIQEIAMANDWHDKYLVLSSQFDNAWTKYKLLDYG